MERTGRGEIASEDRGRDCGVGTQLRFVPVLARQLQQGDPCVSKGGRYVYHSVYETCAHRRESYNSPLCPNTIDRGRGWLALRMLLIMKEVRSFSKS